MFANNKIIIENFQQLIVTLQDDKKSTNKFKVNSFRKVIRIIKDWARTQRNWSLGDLRYRIRKYLRRPNNKYNIEEIKKILINIRH